MSRIKEIVAIHINTFDTVAAMQVDNEIACILTLQCMALILCNHQPWRDFGQQVVRISQMHLQLV